jgi:hypothetical protein
MSVFTSPYNSPGAQHRRLLGVAQEYRSNTEALKAAGLFLGIVGAAFLLVGWAIFSLLGLCMLGAAFAAYHFLSIYDSPSKPASFLLGVAKEYRANAQTLKTAGLWLGGAGAAFVLMGSGIWSFLGLCMLGAALAAYHVPSVHYDFSCKPPSFKCPYCSHQMALFQPWICGHC